MKWSKRNILHLLMILVFLVLISVPLIFADFKGGQISTTENRYLSKFPELIKDKKLNWQGGKLISQFEDWINDNVAFRQEAKLLESKTQIHLLKTPLYDGFQFHDDVVLLWRFDGPKAALHIEGKDQATLDREVDALRQVTEEMQRRGIAFSMTHLMAKYMATDVYLPDTLHPSTETTYNTFSRELSDYYRSQVPNLILTSNFEVMDEFYANEGKRGFHPGFFTAFDASHWNDVGAYLGYQVHMGAINFSYPGVKVFDTEDYDVYPQDYTQTWYGRTYTETVNAFSLKHDRQAIKDPSKLEELGLSDLFNGWGSNTYYHVPGSTAPKALIIGDSYLWLFKLDDVAESFSEVLFVNNENAGELWRIVDAFQPDIVSYCSIRIDEMPRQLVEKQAQEN